MAFFSKIFGGGKPAEKTATPSEAIQKLFETEEILTKKQAYIEKKVEEELATIKANAAKNKRVALAALKRKKRLEKQLEQIDGTLTTLEFQKEALENAGTNAEVMKVMKFAATAMKGAHDNMNIDEVEDLMDDVKEQQQIADEISSAISNPVAFGHNVDEDELEAELEAMQQEELDAVLLETSKTPAEPIGATAAAELPAVPSASLSPAKTPSRSKATKEEEDELAELAKWAN